MRRSALISLLGMVWATTVLAQPASTLPGSTFPLAVTGGAQTLERLGLRSGDRAVALVLLGHGLHGSGAGAAGASLAVTVNELFGPQAAPLPGGTPAVTVLAPFSETLWRRVLELDGRRDVFQALLTDRAALLVAAGALQADEGMREWLGNEPQLLVQIIRQWPGSFALAGPAFSLEDSRIAVPGGSNAVGPWTALVGAPPSQPAEFLRRLLSRDDGRMARFFVNVARMADDQRSALLTPVGRETPEQAISAVYDLARDAEPPWEANLHPFQLSYADLPALLLPLRDLDPADMPASSGHWAALLEARIDSRAEAAQLLRRPPGLPAFAVTMRRMLDGPPRSRRDHVTLIALARRLWDGSAPDAAQADAVYALAQFQRYRALLLMLDRLDIDRPETWARTVDAAREVDTGSGAERALRLGLFQGALALVERARLAGSLSAAEAGRVIDALATPVAAGMPVDRAVSDWIVDVFSAAIPRLVRPDRYSGRTAYESRILQALAGPPVESPPALAWEGLDYLVDVMAGEHERILQIRALLTSPGLDAVLESGDAEGLAEALRTLAYAPALGDPEGGVTLSPDVPARHDFGVGSRSMGRTSAWALAQERTGAGGSWHVAGSLFSLDLALARSALRRLSSDELPPVPTVNLNDQLTLARTAVAILPRELNDHVRDELAAAIGRGRARVAAAADQAEVLALGAQTSWTVADRRTFRWRFTENPETVSRLFSLRDLLWLGEPKLTARELAAWGVIGDTVDGRLTTRMDRPLPWDELVGRPDTGILATQVPDLSLRLAEITAQERVPAVLVPALLLYATQDYWHEVDARFSDDWPAMVRGAENMPVTRIEDYIAALGSGGPLRPR